MKTVKNKQARAIFIFMFVFACFTAVIFSANSTFAKEVEKIDDLGNPYTITLPDKPQYIAPLKTSQTTVKIRWIPANPWAGGKFEVCRYDSTEKKYIHIAYTENTTYTVKNLKKNTKYKFAVREYYEYVYPDKTEKRFGDFSDKLSAYTSTKAPKLSKASYISQGKIKAKWKKSSGIKGYILQYSTSKKFSEKQTCSVVISDETKKEKEIKGLFEKTYYVRLCSYVSTAGRKFCSEWSEVKTVEVKKGISLKTAINSVKTDLSGRKAIKNYTENGVDIKKYKTTYDRMRAIFKWHAKHFKDFANCVECNANFASCVDALYGDKKKFDSFIWLAADSFKNSNGTVVQHKWCVLFVNGVQFIFDPRLQGYTGDFDGTLYFGKTKNSQIGKKYQFDFWYGFWRYGYNNSDELIAT